MTQVSFDFPLIGPVRLPGGLGSWSLAGGRATQPALHPSMASDGPATDPVAFALGRDHAHHGVVPPAALLCEGHPLRAGWDAGRRAFGARTLKANAAARGWLALRLQAWREGIDFDTCHLTPHLLERLQPGCCPVTREPLAPLGTPGSSSCAVRLDKQRSFEPGNLVILGARAAQARTGLGFRDAVEQVNRLEAERETAHRGLAVSDWARLAVLESFALALPHDEAGRLPLLLLPPARVPVANPAQSLQLLLTAQLTAPGYARRLSDLAARVPAPRSRQALQVFLHTLLARRVALGALPLPGLRHGLEDAWRHPLVNQRWQAFVLGLTPAACERLVDFGVERNHENGDGHPKVAISRP